MRGFEIAPLLFFAFVSLSNFKSPDYTGFCGSAPEGRNVYRCSLTKVFLAPAGRHINAEYVAPLELASFFLARAINISPSGADPQNPV
jgi:hypothetical protein